MARPSTRLSRIVKWSAIPVALAASGVLVAQSSYSAFSATTSNPTNNWAVGTVALSDDDTNTAMFNASGLKPGSTGNKCIAVTSSGSLASAVKLYGTSPATTNALSSSITLGVVQGTGGSFGSCTGFPPLGTGSSVYSGSLAAFGSTATSYATGLGSWAPTGSAAETRVFQFTYTVDAAAPNTTQGGTAAIGFTWEAQNT
jgi:hypothetical protein